MRLLPLLIAVPLLGACGGAATHEIPNPPNPIVGQVLGVASPGIWAGNVDRFTYQWQRCSSSCTNIAGAIRPRYRVVSADVGDRLDLVVTASASQISAQTSAVVATPSNVPRPIKP